MSSIYIVMESNGESYQDYQEYFVAVFNNKENAQEHANQLQKEYDIEYEKGQDNYKKYVEESNSLYVAIPWDKDLDNYTNNMANIDIENAIYVYLDNKYPHVVIDGDSKHHFFVSQPIQLITYP